MVTQVQNSKFKIPSSAKASEGKQKGNNSSDSKSSGQASSMADLMRSVKSPFLSLKKGDAVKGRITKLSPSEILLDINAKTEAVVLEKDKRLLRMILSHVKVGDEVTVSVLNPESDMGNPVVSLRRFLDDLLWKDLEDKSKNHSSLSATVTDVTRGGYLVDLKGGLSGFLPNSQTTIVHDGQATDVVGKTIDVYVLDLSRKTRKIIFSQRPVVSKEEFEKTIKKLSVGQKVSGVVTSITTFGVFVSVALEGTTIDGLIHISEISWEKVEDVEKHFVQGQTVEATIIGFDKEAKRADLSIKRLTVDPFEKIGKAFSVDQKVSGTVARITATGVVVDLQAPEGGEVVEGFIRKEKIPPTVSYEPGKQVTATVSQIDTRRHRIILIPVLLGKPIGYR